MSELDNMVYNDDMEIHVCDTHADVASQVSYTDYFL
jgi:hypothetical protein